MKTCPKCKIKYSGSSSRCKSCHNKYMKDWYKRSRGYGDQKRHKEEKRDYIISKKNKPCSDCGQMYPWYVMDFDHRRDKKYNISVMAQKGYSIKKIQEEIDKCDLVCANCHRERTFGRSN